MVPKAELHVHLEGTAPPDLVRRIAQRNGLEIPDGVFAAPDRFAQEVARAAVIPPPRSPNLEGFLAGESWEGKAARFLEEIVKDLRRPGWATPLSTVD